MLHTTLEFVWIYLGTIQNCQCLNIFFNFFFGVGGWFKKITDNKNSVFILNSYIHYIHKIHYSTTEEKKYIKVAKTSLSFLIKLQSKVCLFKPGKAVGNYCFWHFWSDFLVYLRHYFIRQCIEYITKPSILISRYLVGWVV